MTVPWPARSVAAAIGSQTAFALNRDDPLRRCLIRSPVAAARVARGAQSA